MINPAFQYRYMANSLILTCIIIFCLYMANMLFFKQFLALGEEIGLKQDHPFFMFLNDQKKYLNIVYAVFSLVVFIIASVSSLYMSNRIAGPLYRLNKFLLEKASTKETLPPVRFRKGDFFLELAENTNRMLDNIEGDQSETPPSEPPPVTGIPGQ